MVDAKSHDSQDRCLVDYKGICKSTEWKTGLYLSHLSFQRERSHQQDQDGREERIRKNILKAVKSIFTLLLTDAINFNTIHLSHFMI